MGPNGSPGLSVATSYGSVAVSSSTAAYCFGAFIFSISVRIGIACRSAGVAPSVGSISATAVFITCSLLLTAGGLTA